MKKNRREIRDLKQLKEQLFGIKQVVHHTKIGNLWNHEAAVRKKLKVLTEMDGQSLKGYHQVYKEYRDLLDEISVRLLEDYNDKNNTSFEFDEIVQSHLPEY